MYIYPASTTRLQDRLIARINQLQRDLDASTDEDEMTQIHGLMTEMEDMLMDVTALTITAKLILANRPQLN